jgi:HK97 family phage prohead protease
MGEVSVRFAGYASVFDVPDRGGDVVRRGAFRAARDVPLLWQHGGKPVGEIEWIGEDSRGLRVIGSVREPELAGLVAAGAVNGLSFGYRVRQARGGRHRELLALDLMEVSLVASPMNPLARVHAVDAAGMAPGEENS